MVRSSAPTSGLLRATFLPTYDTPEKWPGRNDHGPRIRAVLIMDLTGCCARCPISNRDGLYTLRLCGYATTQRDLPPAAYALRGSKKRIIAPENARNFLNEGERS